MQHEENFDTVIAGPCMYHWIVEFVMALYVDCLSVLLSGAAMSFPAFGPFVINHAMVTLLLNLQGLHAHIGRAVCSFRRPVGSKIIVSWAEFLWIICSGVESRGCVGSLLYNQTPVDSWPNAAKCSLEDGLVMWQWVVQCHWKCLVDDSIKIWYLFNASLSYLPRDFAPVIEIRVSRNASPYLLK